MARTQSPLSLEYILLGFIRQEPIHGYDLYKRLKESEGILLIWRMKQSQVYALLDKLEKGDLIHSAAVQGDNYLRRKQFHITPKGKQIFQEWATCPVAHGRDMRQEFLAKLYFAQASRDKSLSCLIEKQILVCQEWMADLTASYSSKQNKPTFGKLILEYRISQTNAMIEWLQKCLSGHP